MSSIIGIVIVIVLFAACAAFPYLSEFGNPDKVAVGTDGKKITGPDDETYLPHSGILGNIKEELDGETSERVYYVSGAWLWNERITASADFASAGAVPIATVTFASAKHEAQSQTIYYAEGEMFYLIERMVNVYDQQFGWYDNTRRVMDLGEQPQRISKEFYEFLQYNAQPLKGEAYTMLLEKYIAQNEACELSGYWVCNQYIAPPKNASVTVKIQGELAVGYPFKTFGSHYDASGRSMISLVYENGLENKAGLAEIWQENNGGWANEAERYFYLGEEPQVVTGDAYNFFLENARPCTKEEFDAVREMHLGRGDGRNYLGYRKPTHFGKVQWEKEVNILPDVPTYERLVNDDWEIRGDFYSNGEYFSRLYGYRDDETGIHTIYYCTKYKMSPVYSSDTGWVDEAYRIFDCGSDGLRMTFEPYNQIRQFLHDVEESSNCSSLT